MGNKHSHQNHHTTTSQPSSSTSTGIYTPTVIPTSSDEAYRREMEICKQYEIESKMREMHEAKFHQYSDSKEHGLQNLQLVLIIDHSGSMGSYDDDATGQNRSKGLVDSSHWTRYDNVIQAAKYLSESILEYDKDGKIPLIFFDSNVSEVIVDNVAHLVGAFEKNQPNSSTNLYGALKLAFKNHITNHENVLFIVFTDGSPDGGQEPQIKQLIQKKLTKPDPTGDRLNILFIRHGDDSSAINFLKHLDDCEEIRNNVDTKPDNAIYALGPKNLILNSIFEHLDAELAHFV